MGTPSPTKEDSSVDDWSSTKSWTSSSSSTGKESYFLCPSCKRKMFESRSETSEEEDDEYDADSLDMSDTTNGSGYISMDDSSSIDDSKRSYEVCSDTSSCYFCDRSESSSSDTDDFYSESMSVDDFNRISLLEREYYFKEAGYVEIEE